MTNIKVPLIWKKLLVEKQKVVLSSEIRTWSRDLEKNEWNTIRYLQRHKYIVRILRGIFYVRSPDERERDYFERSIYEMITEALKVKGVKNWYFGLETALKLNNMTHEYFDIDFVITDSYRTTKVIKILDSNFKFIKRSKKFFQFGIIKKNKLIYSDAEKTVLDIAYNGYINNFDIKHLSASIKEYINKLDMVKISDYLDYYPNGFKEKIEALL